jgi:hypothetical protein
MLGLLLMLASVPAPVAPVPSVSSAAVATTFAGACSGGSALPSAMLTISWTETDMDRDDYRIDVYENGVLFSSDIASNSATKTVTGYVQGGSFSIFQSNWTYEVRCIRRVDNALISSATSAAHVQFYGACS